MKTPLMPVESHAPNAAVKHSVEVVNVSSGGADSLMEAFLFEPEGKDPHPALILAQHIPVGHSGIENDEFTLTTAKRFASKG